MLQQLKEFIEREFGRQIICQNDCNVLADSVFVKTRQSLSPSTLRRLFGLLPTNSNPGLVTLNILSAYCGFSSWEVFQQSHRPVELNADRVEQLWSRAKSRADGISRATCAAIKRLIPLGYPQTIPRLFVNERFNSFLDSQHSATAIVGPQGYGKSTLLLHWYEKAATQRRHRNDVFLFVHASMVELGVSKKVLLENWIPSLLGADAPNLFETLRGSPKNIQGRFIIIVDAIDEVGDLAGRSERLYQALNQLVVQYSHCQWFKLIVSTRANTWAEFYKCVTSPNDWYLCGGEAFNEHGVNIPSLCHEEIQMILDKTLNQKLPERVVLEELPSEVLPVISHPYYLQLYIDVFRMDTSHLVTDRLDLLLAFLSKEVHSSPCSEEILDILYKIIDLSDIKGDVISARKNDLKDHFPIHLKSGGRYFSAYSRLLSFGLVQEENVLNRFGSMVKLVKITQPYLLDLLIAQRAIERNGGLTFGLFRSIEREFSGTPLLPRLVIIVFSIACKERNVDALKPFYSLSQETLRATLAYPEFLSILNHNEFMRRKLVPEYAKVSLAQKLFIEGEVDINNLAKEGKHTVQSYLQNCTDPAGVQHSRTLLNLSAFLSMDILAIQRDNVFTGSDFPDTRLNSLVAGIWFANRIIYSYYLESGEAITTVCESYELFKREQHRVWNDSQAMDFEMGVFGGLIIARQYGYIAKRFDTIFKNPNDSAYSPKCRALRIYYEYALWRTTNQFPTGRIQIIENHLNELPSFNSNQVTVIGKSFLALCYLQQGKMEKAYQNFMKAYNLSSAVGYRLYEVKLIKNLISALCMIGEEEKAEGYRAIALKVLDKTGLPMERV